MWQAYPSILSSVYHSIVRISQYITQSSTVVKFIMAIQYIFQCSTVITVYIQVTSALTWNIINFITHSADENGHVSFKSHSGVSNGE